jgi:hypothetical protein
MSRTHPTDCEHGVTVDWGDFGPCRNCDDHPDTDDCPNLVDCPDCALDHVPPWLRTVQRIHLAPGEVLAVTVPVSTTMETASVITDTFRRVLPDNLVVIIREPITLAVIDQASK